MSLIPYSTGDYENPGFVERVKKQVFPDFQPENLAFPIETFIRNGLIAAQTYVECLRMNNVNVYDADDVMVNCGVAIIAGPEHVRNGAVYAFKPAKGCSRQHYAQKSVNAIMCFVNSYSGCACKTEGDICNKVRSGDEVCSDLAVCLEGTQTEESDRRWLCEDKVFAVGAAGKLYVAPRFPCGYKLAVHHEGIKYQYADADLISDDPDLQDLVATFLEAERARTFDRDMTLWTELMGKGHGRRGTPGSVWHEKLAAMAHRCREERRIRKTVSCPDMWDDSAMSSVNIGANLDPVPAREETGITFERCDGCDEGQYEVDGTCVDCLTPAVHLAVNRSAVTVGNIITLTFSSENIVDLPSTTLALEFGNTSIPVAINESGSLSFTPTASTTYTLHARTACGNVAATVAVTVTTVGGGGDDGNCDCPDGTPDCLEIAGFTDETFTDTVKVAYIADWGKPANAPAMNDVEAMIQLHSPDYIVTGGDNKYGATMESVLALLPYYRSFRDAERMFTTAGNHDTDDGGLFADYIAAFPYLPGDQRNYSKRLGPVEFFFRETHDISTYPPPDLTLSSEWLQAALAASTAPFKVVVTQDPPFTSHPGDYPGHVESDLPYKEWGADLILSGDSHQYERIIRSNYAPIIICGLGGATKDDDFHDPLVEGSTAHYSAEYGALIIEATCNTLTVSFRNTDDVQIDSLTLTKDAEPCECATGSDSAAAAWDGTLERSAACLWGFQLGTKSYRGQNVSAFILLENCDGDVPVYRLNVLTTNGASSEIIWSGASRYFPYGTYERDSALTCGPLFVDVGTCDCIETPTVTFDPPSGSFVSFPTTVFITASDDAAQVFYTLDGSEPTNNSTACTGPITVAATDVLRARAYLNGCAGAVASADYTAVAGFSFDYICDTVDKVGVFNVFTANGHNDYHWVLQFGLTEEKTINRVEVYETNAQGVWVSGQAWATDNPIYPDELNGDPFSVYPCVITQDGVQLNSDYLAVIGTLPAGNYVWELFGQPFIPLTGYFKLKFVMDDGAGGEDVVYKLIPHDCYYCDDYTTFGGCTPPTNDRSPNILNVAIKHTGTTTKSGAAAVGLAGDFWNTCNFLLPGDPDASRDSLKWANGTDSGVSLNEYNEQTALNPAVRSIFDDDGTTSHVDPMMANLGQVMATEFKRQLRFINLGHGTYDIYVYGHGELNANIVNVSARSALIERPYQQTEASDGWLGPFSTPVNYVKFSNFTFSQLEEATLSLEFVTGANSYVNGIQIVKKA